MNMTNFLPWRQQRRARCLRFWAGVFAGALLLMLLAVFSVRMNHLVTLRALQAQLAGTQSVQRGLVSRQRPTAEAQKPAGTPPRRAWQRVLETLSGAMPAQVWPDRAALSASSSDVDRICHHPAGALCLT